MLTYAVPCAAPAEAAWPLMARPARWSEWAPHVRGAWGLGSPEVRPGARGAVRLLGLVPVPARILDKRPGRSWSWRVGPVELDHLVDPLPRGCLVSVRVRAAAPLEAALKVSYGPLIALLVRRLAAVAQEDRSAPRPPR
ncbi:MAG TPA: SRPBCC family protein [Solirubrobacteraceae bacterium]|nr:SRPBCC family protein [Solirubrobacteraceae bacterium]